MSYAAKSFRDIAKEEIAAAVQGRAAHERLLLTLPLAVLQRLAALGKLCVSRCADASGRLMHESVDQ